MIGSTTTTTTTIGVQSCVGGWTDYYPPRGNCTFEVPLYTRTFKIATPRGPGGLDCSYFGEEQDQIPCYELEPLTYPTTGWPTENCTGMFSPWDTCHTSEVITVRADHSYVQL